MPAITIISHFPPNAVEEMSGRNAWHAGRTEKHLGKGNQRDPGKAKGDQTGAMPKKGDQTGAESEQRNAGKIATLR